MDKKKLSIIEKGLELFNLYGIRSVTMEDLSREMGVSKKTLYHYFSNKSELVTEAMAYSARIIRTELEAEPDEEINAIKEFFFNKRAILKKLSRQNTAIAFDLRKYYPELFNMLKEMRRKLLYDIHKKNLDKGIKQDLYRETIDIDFISKLMTGGHSYTFDPIYGIFPEEELLSDKFRRNLFNYHFRGICSEKGMAVFNQLMQQTEPIEND
jgi:AcrR family transcriptional regulator